MRNRFWKSFVLLVLILNLTVSSIVATDTPKASKNEKAAAFSLKDQYNNETKFQFPREKVTILAIADNDGAKQLEEWLRPLAEKYHDKVDIQGIAELSGVPGIAKGIVRNIIKKKTAHPVMLDWSGDVSKSLGFQKDSANLILIDKTGNIVARRSGAVNSLRLMAFSSDIDQLLR